MNGYDYTYYLFVNGRENEPVKITAITLNLVEYVKEKIHGIKSDMLTPNSAIFLFNALFSSNEELLRAVVGRYNSLHPRSKYVADDFDYIALLSAGQYTKDYKLLKYSYSSKIDPESKEKLIPIVYEEDLSRIINDGAMAEIKIDENDITHPCNLLVKIFSSMRGSVPYKDQYSIDFDSMVEQKYYQILKLKYDNAYDHLSEKDKYRLFVDYEDDTRNIINLLNCNLIRQTYKKDSTLYFNLLSSISHDYKMKEYVAGYKMKYNPLNNKVGFDDASVNLIANTAIRTVSEMKETDELNREAKVVFNENNKTDEQIVLEVINKYNLEHNTNITFSDIESNPKEFEELIYELDDAIKFHHKGSQR